MGRRHLKPGDEVEFTGLNDNNEEARVKGIVQEYKYPTGSTHGYVEIVDEDGNSLLTGNADLDIEKVRNSK